MRNYVDHDALEEMIRLGYKQGEIVERLGCSPSMVCRKRRDMGLNTHRPTRRRIEGELKALIESLLDDGWSFIEIERTHGISSSTLRHHFPGRGWTLEQRLEIAHMTRHLGRRIKI